MAKEKFQDVLRILNSPKSVHYGAYVRGIRAAGHMDCPAPPWDPTGTYRLALEGQRIVIQHLVGTQWQPTSSEAQIPEPRALGQGVAEPETELPQVFVSHSSRDADTAQKLIELLRVAVPLRAAEIRCTSVDGYRLPVGADTNTQLREEVNGAVVLLGIISAQSLRSLYVVFELGARWGSGKPFFPLLAPGTPSSALAGPLSGINTLRLDHDAQVHQLISELAQKLGRTPEPPAAYTSELKGFCAAMEQQQLEAIASTLEEQNALSPDRKVSAYIVDAPGQLTVRLPLTSHYFSSDAERDYCVLDDCLVLVCAAGISRMSELLPILEQVARAQRSLFLVARDVTGEALATLIKNSQMGIIRVCVGSTSATNDPSQIERAIAKRTGAMVFHDEAQRTLADATLSDLGEAAKIEAVESNVTIHFGRKQ